MKYKCVKCNKEFKQKGHYDAHINKKYPCDNIIDVNNNLTNIVPKLHPKYTQITPIVYQNTLNNTQIVNNNLCCNYCGISFTRKQSLDRHLIKSCKKKLTTDNNLNTVMEELQKMKEDNIKLKERINEIEQLII